MIINNAEMVSVSPGRFMDSSYKMPGFILRPTSINKSGFSWNQFLMQRTDIP